MKKGVKKKKGHPIIIKELTFGQKAADKVTTFCGSWAFILSVIGLIVIWIILNSLAFINHWDPWPFIILNLTLSCLAALQAPIILMSQNRQAERDRIQVKYDYTVDRKAERGIRQLLKDVATMKKYMYENKKLTAPKKLKTKK